MTILAQTNQIREPVRRLVILDSEETEGTYVMNVKRSTECGLWGFAEPAFMDISTSSLAGLANPIRPVIIRSSSDPRRIGCATPILGFPFAKTCAVTEQVFRGLPSVPGRSSNYCLAIRTWALDTLGKSWMFRAHARSDKSRAHTFARAIIIGSAPTRRGAICRRPVELLGAISAFQVLSKTRATSLIWHMLATANLSNVVTHIRAPLIWVRPCHVNDCIKICRNTP